MSDVVEKTLASLPKILSEGLLGGPPSPRKTTTRGFQNFIRLVNKARSKQEEEHVVKHELSQIQQQLSLPDTSQLQVCDFLCRLLYCGMLGYDVTFGYIHAIKLAQNTNTIVKRMGYLATSLLLHEDHELILLLINTIQKDLQSSNMLHNCIALNATCQLVNSEMVPMILPLVQEKLRHPRELVRVKATTCMLRFVLKTPNLVEHCQDLFKASICDKDPGVMAIAVNIYYHLAKIMGRKRVVSLRNRAEEQKLRMRERRAARASVSNVPDGLGEPSPYEGKSPNALRLTTPQGSLSTPHRGIPLRSDSPPCVCTPPSVPPFIDGAGQATTTDSGPSVCIPQRVPLLPCNAVVSELNTKVVQGNETVTKVMKQNWNRKSDQNKQMNETVTKLGKQNWNRKSNKNEQMIETITKLGKQNLNRKSDKNEQMNETVTKLGKQNLNRKSDKNEQMNETVTKLGKQNLNRKSDKNEQMNETVTKLGKQNWNKKSDKNEQINEAIKKLRKQNWNKKLGKQNWDNTAKCNNTETNNLHLIEKENATLTVESRIGKECIWKHDSQNISSDIKEKICDQIIEIGNEDNLISKSSEKDRQSCNSTLGDNISDIIFLQETEPEMFKFKPLCVKSKEKLIQQLKLNISNGIFKNTHQKQTLGNPKEIRSILGDGNCFFRALSYSISNTEENHKILRSKIVNNMLTNDVIYTSHLRSGERSVGDYIFKKGMLNDGTWATEIEILAAADFLRTDIYIFEESRSTWLKFSARLVYGFVNVGVESIYLIHKFQAHYDVVLNVEDRNESVETFVGNGQNVCFSVMNTGSQDRVEIDKNFPKKQLNLPLAVQGHFDQSHPRFLDNAGKQCVMNSLSALIYSQEKPTTSWTSDDVDQILVIGNEMYEYLHRSSTFQHDFIAVHEIPRSMEYNGKMYTFTFQESLTGTLGNTRDLDEFQLFTLNEALHISLSQTNSNAAFVTFKGNTFVVIRQNSSYCVIDSHSRSLAGTLDPYGSSIVLHYADLNSVFEHCLHLAESMCYQADDIFEVTAVEISRESSTVAFMCKFTSKDSRSQTLLNETCEGSLDFRTDPWSRLGLYFQDQKNRKMLKHKESIKDDACDATASSNSRKEYMQKYMKKLRQSSKWKSLQEVDKKRKKNARERDPEKHRAVDQKSKKKAREKDPEKHRAIDHQSKRNAREKDPEKHRAIDHQSKRNAREKDPDKHRAIDHQSKRNARKKDPEKHRAIDHHSKRNAREKDPEKHRAIDHQSKRNAREKDPEKQKAVDLKSKQKARNDPNYLAFERENKNKARENDPIKHRRIDYKSKKNAREKDPEKLQTIDLRSKRKSRSDLQFAEQERLSKKKARLDPVFLQKEAKKDLTRKRQLRLDKTFLENERWKQTGRRRHTSLEGKASERKRKAEYRKSKSYSQHEKKQYKKRRFGDDTEGSVSIFHKRTEKGPEYVCTCCHQTWFRESVTESCPIPLFERYKDFYTGYKSVDKKEWICHTCISTLKKCKVPKLSVANGMKWPDKPKELDLHPLEERLISLRIPFMQIRELPRGGQYSTKGNVVNIPIDIQPTVNALPRQMDEHVTIAVKLKKRLAFKSYVFSENVRPTVVLGALHWLMHKSELYKTSGVEIDDNWIKEVTSNANEIVQEFTRLPSQNIDVTPCRGDENGRSDPVECRHSDTDCINLGKETNLKIKSSDDCKYDKENQDSFIEEECVEGNYDTLIDEANLDTNKAIVLAPGEGQQPVSLYHDKDAEVLSFPTIYCGQKRVENCDRQVPVSYSDVAKWELRSIDRRAATCVPNIFFKLNKIQRKQVADKVTLAIRRKKSDGKKITAQEARNPETADKIVSLNEGYYIFRTLRNSPAYLSSRKKDVFAMIRQLGLPTWFMSLSSADTRWQELLKTLAVLAGVPCFDEDIENMTWSEKAKLVQKDPVTCCRYFDHRVQVFMNTVLKGEHSPIGIVTDTFQRIEFQNRGSPHVHMMIWTENAPKYNVDIEDDIVKYVDNYMTCSLDVDEDLQELVKMQIHKHSKTCKKGNRSVCRFGFPLPPLKKTMVLEPLETDVEEYRKKYSEIHAEMNKFKDGCDMSYDEFLKDIVQMEEKEYIRCIRSSLKGPKVFLKRTPSEMRVNYYNTVVLKAWKANLDLQFVLDPYACAMYIVSYISKSQRGMSTMLEQASKEAADGNMDLKRQVRHIGNKFLNFVEISAQEASYLVLQMPLTRASREVVFINTSPPSQRVFLIKSQEQLEILPGDSTDIACDGIIKRYAHRPRKLEKYCLADYVSELEVKYKQKEQKAEIEHNDDDKDLLSVSKSDSESDCDTEISDSNTVMKLQGGITIRQRNNPRVIRYVRYSKNTDAENFYREKLFLFMPWRDEEKDLKGGHDTHEEHFKEKYEDILTTIQKYEQHVDELDIARHQAEEDLATEFDTIAPNAEQVQAEDAEQSINQSEEFFHFLPPVPSQSTIDIGHDLNIPGMSMSVETNKVLLPDDKYMALLRSLNIKQREFFNHIMRWIATKNDPIYAFLSGGAGVGKSVVIQALYQALHRLLNSKEGDDPDSIKILLTAFTGKAAYNINGITIASAFHKKMFQTQQHMHIDELNTFRTMYKDLKIIIIDEISMVGNKLLAFIHDRLKELTCTNRDFGGISIIAVGDLYQLSPVADSWIFSDMPVPLAKNLWKEHFQIFELNEIMRQKDDLAFAEMLNRLRFNQLQPKDKEIIKSHLISPVSASYPKKALHLFTENKRVDDFNSKLIQELETTKVDVFADTDVISPANLSKDRKAQLIKEMNNKDKHNQTGNLPSVLKLAVDMKYDITVNVDVQDGLTNGASGIVKHIEYKEISNKRPAIVWVLFNDISIGSKRRLQYRHLLHKGIDKQWTPVFETKRTFLYNRKTYERVQFPLTPAAAKTVHKAQGATVDELVVDLRSSYRAPHIHYVALSRVRRLANLHILDFNEKAITVDERVHKEMERLYKNPLQRNPEKFHILVPILINILQQIVNGNLPSSFEYHSIPSPWLQIQILKTLAILGEKNKELSEQMYSVLGKVLQRVNMKEYMAFGIMYECIATITSIYPNEELLQESAKCVRRFIRSPDHNLKYIGVKSLTSLVKGRPESALDYQMIVVELLDDPDYAIQRKTLELLYNMANPVNVQVVCDRLLNHMTRSLNKYWQMDIVVKVTNLAEKFSTSGQWYVDTMIKLLQLNKTSVPHNVVNKIIKAVQKGCETDQNSSNNLKPTEFKQHLIKKCVECLFIEDLPTELVHVSVWVLGEFAEMLNNMPEDKLTSLFLKQFTRITLDVATKSWIISSMLKLTCCKILSVDVIKRNFVDIERKEENQLIKQKLRELIRCGEICPDLGSARTKNEGKKLQMDFTLSFLDDYVSESLERGGAPYKPCYLRRQTSSQIADDKSIFSGLNHQSYGAPSVGSSGLKPTDESMSSEGVSETSKNLQETELNNLKVKKRVWGKEGFLGHATDVGGEILPYQTDEKLGLHIQQKSSSNTEKDNKKKQLATALFGGISPQHTLESSSKISLQCVSKSDSNSSTSSPLMEGLQSESSQALPKTDAGGWRKLHQQTELSPLETSTSTQRKQLIQSELSLFEGSNSSQGRQLNNIQTCNHIDNGENLGTATSRNLGIRDIENNDFINFSDSSARTHEQDYYNPVTGNWELDITAEKYPGSSFSSEDNFNSENTAEMDKINSADTLKDKVFVDDGIRENNFNSEFYPCFSENPPDHDVTNQKSAKDCDTKNSTDVALETETTGSLYDEFKE